MAENARPGPRTTFPHTQARFPHICLQQALVQSEKITAGLPFLHNWSLPRIQSRGSLTTQPPLLSSKRDMIHDDTGNPGTCGHQTLTQLERKSEAADAQRLGRAPSPARA